ncbi:carbohydrate ABC transporter permease [Cohnella cellulosilytica]|uniref:Carbohydrate ABC transporter permease n=1 Tax=Cohnella cellulosilytica TaxID=986710 RepID=A0ABW2FGB4_9BACL
MIELPGKLGLLLPQFLVLLLAFGAFVLIGVILVRRKKIRQSTLTFHLFISPWTIGFLFLTLGPILYSLYLSFTEWDIVNPPKFVGTDNYERVFTGDASFYKSLTVTFYYTFLSVPLQLVLGFAVALLMNQKVPGMRIFRTVYYVPSLVSGVAVSVLWLWIFHPNFGLLNDVLGVFGIEGINWLMDVNWALPSLILMSLWGIGGTMVIYLAGLQDIPATLYEAAEIEGANRWHKLRYVTIPMMTPIIFFNLIMGIIGSFQTFTQAFIMTEGGPKDSTLFYVLKLYNHAFLWFEMGYASALAWVLFVILIIFTALVFRSSAMWVYYEGEVKKQRKGARAHG